jgi:ubiquinone/menaquinone biosynthesis C-methylase UbiE
VKVPMPLLLRDRVPSHELLDEHDAPWDETTRSLRDLRMINQFAGGIRTYRRLLQRLSGREPIAGKVVLDLGTGTSDLLADAEREYSIRSIGLDFKIDHLLYGRSIEADQVRRICGNAMTLPFADASVDIVTSAHFFHHFSPEENRSIIAEALRVARLGIAINDTRRHLAPFVTVKFLGLLRMTGRITRHDAPASVRQGYTMREVEQIVAPFRTHRIELVKSWAFRFGLLIWK